MEKVIFFELNEVPFRVIDHYCKQRPNSALAGILGRSKQYETYTEDSLSLDPWVSWPTMHRGVPDAKHKILHLGQVLDDADEAYPPVWRILKKSGISVGVFGSLHSSAVPADAREYSFYLPDYFDNRVFAHPEQLAPFQEFNLKMTRGSARNVSRKLPLTAAAKFLATAPSLGATATTFFQIGRHLFKEIFNKDLRIRRRNFQPLLSFDLFLKQVSKKKPQFASFYSNHVAAAMHRYWGAAFPQDFAPGALDRDWIDKYGEEVVAAMDAFEDMLKHCVSFVDKNKEYALVIASSMGQSAIPASHTYEFLTITDLGKFLSAMGVPQGNWEIRPAMVPCQGVVVPESHRTEFLKKLSELKIGEHSFVESIRPQAPMSYDERERGFFQLFIQFDHFDPSMVATINGQPISFEDLGLGLMAHEDGVNCTAQHVPEGSLIVYKAGQANGSGEGRKRVSTVDFVPSVLAHFKLPIPEYLEGRPSISFS